MFAKFISLLVLLIIIAGLIYVAVIDVNIPQKQRIVSITPEITDLNTSVNDEDIISENNDVVE